MTPAKQLALWADKLRNLSPLSCGEGAVIDEGGNILLMQRPDSGLWTLPGDVPIMDARARETGPSLPRGVALSNTGWASS